MDGVQRANSGHPGTPMALAPVAYLLYTRFMRHNPRDPAWPDRDRFVLSAGHASMLLYSVLHLTGYDLPLSELERFRQWGSKTPGHPERDLVHATPGVETTTGPLGQGFGNGVGMAMAERFLRERYGSEVVDHRTFAICSDGDLMEGISAEAASIAGHLGLGRLVYLFDDNHITIDGSTDKNYAGEDVEGRFRAYGWHTLAVEDVNDLDELGAAIQAGIDEEERPTLIRMRTIIGWPAPTKQNSASAHGAPLGEDEVRATKEILGWNPNVHFFVPDGVYAHSDRRERGAALQAQWSERFEAWRSANAELADEWDKAQARRGVRELGSALPVWDPADTPKMASRVASFNVIQAVAAVAPTFIGGAADLAESVRTTIKGAEDYTRETAGRNINWGVREHAMGAAVNGLALHGGLVRPFGASFLIFTDYMRTPIRLSALMQAHSTWVFSHDSVGLGEDGPTHQPIEMLAALRAVPGLTVIRPADANETAQAWRVILEELDGPALLALSRQDLPTLDPALTKGLVRGAYVLAQDGEEPDVVIIGTGSEVGVALEARELLAAEEVSARIVSMPSWELFAAQDAGYRAEVLPNGVPCVSVEAATTFGWERWADRCVGIDRFGASAPGAEVLQRLGITPVAVAEAARSLLDD